MNTDRINQFLVTCLVVVVLVSQFNRTQTIEHIDMTPRYSGENLSEDDNPALSEEKYGLFSRLFNRNRPARFIRPQSNCPDETCPQVQPQGSIQPTGKPQANPNCPDDKCPLVTSSIAAKEAVKTGMVRCSCCNRVTVGDDLHTEWTENSEPISPCCDDCWHRMTHEQRINSVERWARGAGISDEAVLARFKRAIK